MLLVNEPLSITVVALTARFVSVGAVCAVFLVAELKLINSPLVCIPSIPGPVRHFVDVLECCVARFFAASVPESCSVAMAPFNIPVRLLDAGCFWVD